MSEAHLVHSLSPAQEPVAWNHIKMAFEYLQEWRIHNLSGHPVPMFCYPHSIKGYLYVVSWNSGLRYKLIKEFTLANKCLLYHIFSRLASSPKLHLKLNCLKKMDAWQLLKICKFKYYWNWICFRHEELGLPGFSIVLRSCAGIAKVLYKNWFFLAAAAYVHRTVLGSVTCSWEPGIKLIIAFWTPKHDVCMHKSESFKETVFWIFFLSVTLVTLPWNLQVYKECSIETNTNRYKQPGFLVSEL